MVVVNALVLGWLVKQQEGNGTEAEMGVQWHYSPSVLILLPLNT